MKNVLCLTDSSDDVTRFVKNAHLLFFQIEQLDPEEHRFSFFKEIYEKLKASLDLSKVDLIIAEYIDAIPLVYFMRKDGFFAPAIFIPHTNAYPLNILFYFLQVSYFSHPDDRILCGSKQAVKGYESLVNIKALPIATFGIKSIYKKGDKQEARKALGLSENHKYLLFTGRFMNDKGLDVLLNIYERVKSQVPNVVLLISSTHIDPHYFNHLAPRLKDVILFYRLEREQLQLLYQSSDLFLCVATSIFETYGKSPLEALACGVPVILPRWDGFPYYMTPTNGELVNVEYGGPNEDAPYSFAKIDEVDCSRKVIDWLNKDIDQNIELPSWAFYDQTMITLNQLIEEMLLKDKFIKKINPKEIIPFDHYSEIIAKICNYYEIRTWEDLELQSDQLGLTNREDPGDLHLLKELHDQLFRTMDESHEYATSHTR